MRVLSAFMLMVAAFAAPSARADITAVYDVWGPLGPTMKVQVAANGDARLEMGGRLTGLRRGGTMYLVRTDRRGAFVLRLAEFERIEAQMGDAATNAPLPQVGAVRFVESGTEVVGGRTGTVLSAAEARTSAALPAMAFVFSADADLRPVGDVVAVMLGGRSTITPPSINALVEPLWRRGTMIRMWFMFRLASTNADPIPAAAFDLPGPVLSGEQAQARLGRAW